MNIYSKKFSISMPWAIVVVTCILLAIFSAISILFTKKSIFENEGPLWVFACGVVSGLVVTLAQFCLTWADAAAIDRFRRMGVENILTTRDDPTYYGPLIKRARSQLDVLGSSATRLMDDFADIDSPKSEKHALIDILKNQIPVRILVAAPEQLDADDAYKYIVNRRRFETIANKYPKFEVRYFHTIPLAAFVRVDHELVVGPLLPGVASKHTPALHVYNHSPYATSYLKYFEETWTNATPLGQMPPLDATS